MDLKEKLARLSHPAPELRPRPALRAPVYAADDEAPRGTSERLLWLRSRLDAMGARVASPTVRRRRRAPPPEPTGLPGGRREFVGGEVHLLERHLDATHLHGDVAVAAGSRASMPCMGELALDASLAEVDAGRLLFFDTETTGLSGGSGTLAFLIGLAWFDEGRLRVEQLLLTRPSDEPAALRRLTEHLERASGIVSYNGKSFDWPLLRNRFVMAREPVPEPPPHLDLLHSVRRVYKRSLESFRLTAVEREILNFHRLDDVDGSEIPALYWDFLRSGDGYILEPILEHNANDVIALAALLGLLSRAATAPEACADRRVRLSLAEVALRNQNAGRAVELARAAADGDEPVTLDALQLVARLERRLGKPDVAAAALEEALAASAHDHSAASVVHLGLAKLYEHRLKQPARALEHAQCTEAAEGGAAQRKRITRLEARLERLAARTAR